MDSVIPSQQERVYFHPVVKLWLEDRGYEAWHEIGLRRGIPDFIATCPDHVLIVECKLVISERSVFEDLWQVYRYYHLFCLYHEQRPVKLVLAAKSFHQKAKEICANWNVGVLHLPGD